MADIDRLDIQISAESTDAVEKVNALVSALERLKSTLNSVGKASGKIKQIGQEAKAAMPQSVKAKTIKLRKVSTSKPQGSISDNRNVSDALEENKMALENLSATSKAGFDIVDSSDINDIKELNQAIQDTGSTLESLADKKVDVGTENLAQDFLDAQKSATGFGKILSTLKEKLASIKGVKIKPEKADTTPLNQPVSNEIPEYEKQITNLKQEIEETKSALQALSSETNSALTKTKPIKLDFDSNKLNQSLASASLEIEKADNKLTSLKRKLDSLQTKQGKGIDVGVDLTDVESKISEYKEKLNGAKTALADLSEAAQNMKATPSDDDIAKVKELTQAYKDASFYAKTAGKSASESVRFAEETAKFKAPTKISAKETVSPIKPIKNTFSNVLDTAAKSVGKLENAFKKALSAGIAPFKAGITSLGSYLKSKFVSPIQKAVSSIQKLGKTLSMILFYDAAFAALQLLKEGIKEGIDNLYQYSQAVGTNFAPAMDSLATSALYLKNSLAAMAAPLISAIAPAIDFLISKLATLLNMIGAVFAALTGRGVFTTAKKQATQFGDAVGGAAGSAKELKDYMLGIDELNVINDNGGGGGGGGGGGLNFEDMFEETELPDWAKRIKDAIDAGDWYGAGQALADHLNDVLEQWDAYAWGNALGTKIQHALEFALGFLQNFNFDGVGQKLAQGITGIMDAVNPETLGATIGSLYNALFSVIHGFVTTLPWGDIGNYIATALNSWQYEIKWEMIGETISEGFKGVFGLINNVLTGFDWAGLGNNVATMLNTIDWHGIVFRGLMMFINALKAFKEFADSFIASFKWEDTARQIYSAINDAFAMMDWAGLGQTVGNLFITVFNFIRDTIAGIDWAAIGRDIGEFIAGIDWLRVFESAKNAINEAVKGLVAAIRGFIEEAPPEVIATIVLAIASIFAGGKVKLVAAIIGAVALIKDQMADIGKALGEAINKLGEGLPALLSNLGTVLSDALIGIFDGLTALVTTIDWNELGRNIVTGLIDMASNIDWSGVVSSLFEFFGATIAAAVDLTLGIASAIGEAIGNAIDSAGQYFQDKIEECGGNVVEGILKGIVDAIAGIGSWIYENIFQPFIDGFKSVFGIHSPSTVMAEQGGFIISGLLQGITDGIGAVIEAIGGILSGIGEAISGAWEGIKTGATKAWEGISGVVTDAWDSISSTASTVWEGITSTIGSAWETLTTKASETWNGLKETVGGAWQNVKETTTNVWNGVTTWLGDTWNKLTGKEKTEFGNMKTDIAKQWDETNSNTNTKWNAIDTMLQGTWSGLEQASLKEFTQTFTNISDVWDNTETKTDASWNAQKTLLEGVWTGLNTQSQKDFNEIWNTVDTAWTDSQNSTDQKWNATSTIAQGIWQAMNTATSTNFSSMSKTVETETTAQKSSVDKNIDAAKALQLAHMVAMNTNTVFQFVAMNKTVSSQMEEVKSTSSTKSKEAIDSIKTNFGKATDAVTSGLKSALAAAKSVDFTVVGRGIADGIKAGLEARLAQVRQTAVDGVNSVLNAAKRAAQIHSPSRLFRTEIGENIGLGMALGIEDTIGDMESAMEQSIGSMQSALDQNALEANSALKFQEPEKLSASYAVQYSRNEDVETEDSTQQMADGMKIANEDVITALQAGFAQMLEAVADIANRPMNVTVGAKTIMKANERGVRERGANILAGGLT